MANPVIYKITSPTNKVYIGQSWNVSRRVMFYKNVKCNKQTKLYNSLQKHGWAAHSFEVVLEIRDDISQETLNFWEQYFMDLYRANYELLNLREAGNNGKFSPETIEKLRISHLGQVSHNKGKQMTESQKEKLRRPRPKIQGANHPMFGKKLSPERLAKLNSNKPLISPRKGAKFSEESIIKLKKSLNERWKNGQDHNKIPVLQFSKDNEFIKEWPSITEAAKTLSINRRSISYACSGKGKTSGGFKWQHKINK